MRPPLATVIAAALVALLLSSTAEAFWGFGAGEGSGLNLIQGYDRNTVTTVTGRVTASPDQGMDPVQFEIVAGSERIVTVLGPRWYLQDDDLSWKAGDTVTVRGSLAQGRDGRSYLLAQWVTMPGGRQLVLRSDTGRPGWSGGYRGGTQGDGLQLQRGGAAGRRGR